MSISRRKFVSIACRSIASIGAFGAFSRFGALNAFAQAPDYKALVCVFLFGGNDGNNIVIPFDDPGYLNYQTLRGRNNGVAGVALDQSVLLPIQPASTPGLPFALHPQLTHIRDLFNNKKVAIVANVGNLVFPTTRSQYINHQIQVPANLFSHSDQQNQMQTAGLDSKSPSGWAGRVADAVQSMNTGAQYPAVVSLAGAPIFCNGDHTSPASVSPGNLSGVNCAEFCTTRSNAAQQLLTFDTGISLVQAASQITTNANKYTKVLSDAVSSSPALLTQFPNTGIANQLKQVAQIIQARNALALHRQIFFVSLGGFDTHGAQLTTQDALLAQLSPALKAFYDATVEMGVDSQVTTFLESDFARTFQPNTNGGTDHAWGNHYFVMGGAVKGGDMYGKFPIQALGVSDDAGSNGRWIPTTSLDQYGATLAAWFGVSATDMPTVFPTLKNFTTQNIGFV